MRPIETRGHLYVEGAASMTFSLKPNGKIKIGLDGTAGMLMRFGGNPATNPNFGFLAVATASPWIQIGPFLLDLSGIKGVALMYIDVPSANDFKFALSMTAELSVNQLFTNLIPWLPQFCKDAITKFMPGTTWNSGFRVYADSEWWGFKIGPIPIDLGGLFGKWA